MSLDNLLVNKINVDDIGELKKLAAASSLELESPETWTREILQHLNKELPFLSQYKTMVNMVKVNKEAGFGYGNIVVQGSVVIPILISTKNSKTTMAPLDVFKYKGTFQPLTKERIDAIMFDPAVGQVRRMSGQDAWGSDVSNFMQPPDGDQSNGSRFIHKLSSIENGRPTNILEVIAPTADKEDIVKVAELILTDDRIYEPLTSDRANNQVELITKIAAAKASEKVKESVGSAFADAVKSNVIHAEKMPCGNVKVVTISDNSDDEKELETDPITVRGIIGDDNAREVSENGFKTVVANRVGSSAVQIDDDITEQTSFITNSGKYSVVKEAGDREVMNVLNEFDFNNNMTGNLIASNGHSYCRTNELAGIKIASTTNAVRSIPQDEVYMSFMVDGKVASTPFKYTGRMIRENGITKHEANINGEIAFIEKTADVISITKHKGTYYVPDSYSLIRLGDEVKLKSTPESIKEASLVNTKGPKIKLMKIDNEYQVTDKNLAFFKKVANILTPSETSLFLAKHGSSQSEIPLIMKRAEDDNITLSGLKPKEPKIKVAKCEKTSEIVKRIKGNVVDKVKLAAIAPGNITIDAILSLGFINDENISKFEAFVPMFRDCVNNLASLLVAVRMGMETIDEGAVKSAMTSLDKAYSQLKTYFDIKRMESHGEAAESIGNEQIG